uniref:Uncharacterized protein n=1 Tax=Rhizophora mucronata TaxID=61149 RepID=A0A2P2NRJ9_RHIMU
MHSQAIKEFNLPS